MAKIIIVEDEKDLRDIYKEILVGGGHKVVTAENGSKALEYLQKNKVDLILLDLMMPEMDGIEVLKTVRASQDKFGNPRVVVLTNLSNDAIIKESFAAKADGYLMKTELTPQQVLKEVNGFLV